MDNARPFARRLLVLAMVAALAASACAGTSDKKKDASGGNGDDKAKVIPPATANRSTTTRAAGPTTTTALAPATEGSQVKRPGGLAVGSLEVTYVDPTRKTSKNGNTPEKPSRTLPTFVLYPALGRPGADSIANARPAPGPWPLVVFSHGVGAKGRFYATTLRVLASAGYVVIAPDYPLSNTDAKDHPVITDVAEQTRDIKFLIDQLLKANKTAGSRLTGLIDPARIGLLGQSLGAITSLGAGFNACCAEPRARAVAEWAGIFFPLESGGKVAPLAKGRPLLILHGDADGTVNYRFGRAAYKLLGPPKYFITLPGAGHIPSYIQGVGTPQSKVVTLSTIDFFDRYLKGDKAGIDRLHKIVTAAGPANATEQEDPG